MSKRIDLTGQRFGRLIVSEFAGTSNSGNALFKCKCDCGNEKIILGVSIKKGITQSCGCLVSESNKNEKDRFKNTRITTLSSKISRANKSGEKGVYFHNKGKRWAANITLQGKCIHLGLFNNINDAITARKEAEEKYFKPVIDEYEALKEGELNS